ncbi:MAG: ISNCY family transposase [Elusimicrobia bacterium]|nr:ISNCY family transposase [Elusimicrobiota bacterium]
MEQLTMSNREIDKLKVIQNTIDGKLTWPQAAESLSISERQVGRLCSKVRKEGNRGIIHGLKGLPSNNKLAEAVTRKAISLVTQHFADFGPTLANEHLLDDYEVRVSTNTLRKLMIGAGLYDPKAYKPKHRSWRERRSCVGMLVQLDGSEHDWFEGRGPKCALLVFIDDATSQILYARFITVEDTVNLMRCTKAYLKINGRPVAIYVDKDSIYKINRQASIDEELRDEMPLSQFTRAMGELDVDMIFANSPQAKGRVERGFRTHQDRLVKELRLAGISDMAAANEFLEATYIAKHNGKFAVVPASRANAHRPLLKTHKLDGILCVKLNRTLANDYTLRFKNRFFQVTAGQDIRIRPGNVVAVEERLDGSLHLKFKGTYLRHKAIEKRPYKGYYAANINNLLKVNGKQPSKSSSIPGKPQQQISIQLT